jgi:hypothetical protein
MSWFIQRKAPAFIKGRFIQDNFKPVQASAKLLHAKKRPSILLKIDIARAFDSVAGPFLIDILRHLGFPSKWVRMDISLAVIGEHRNPTEWRPREENMPCQRLRQGDSLSPLLFILVMEALNAMLCRADQLMELVTTVATRLTRPGGVLCR